MGNVYKLNDLWNFTTDPNRCGEEEKWYLGLPAGDRYPVPGIWQTYRPDLYNYTGYAWYSREFSLPPEGEKRRIFLEFAAVDYRADVWLNGKLLGSHEGGYTPFRFEITNKVQYDKDNLLVVRVFDPEENEEIPHGKQGSWYSRVSGIWQDVRLIFYHEAFVEKLKITSDLDQDTVHFAVVGNGIVNLKNPNLEFKIYQPENQKQILMQQTFPYRENGTYSIRIAEPRYWHPDTPWLYDAEIVLKDGDEVQDRFSTYFGLRKIHWQAGQLFLNNEPLYIRGALDQAFWPETIYYAPRETLIQDEIQKAKDMGFNLLRKHIKTEDPRYLYWADRLGMLIWAEPPNCSKWSKLAKDRFKEELFALIDRDYNHPSIIIWSIYNEEWGLEWKLRSDREKQLWVEELFQAVKVVDPTRLVCDNSGWAHVRTDLNDYHRYFALPELYREWEEDLDRIVASPADNFVVPANHQGEPVLISEFGMWGLPEKGQATTGELERVAWFDGSARIFTEEFKVPALALTNFSKYGLDRIFTDLNELARLAQRREFYGVKFIIEEMRKRPQLAGYVVTELTDVEWETNGFLTYNRQLKAGFDRATDFNGETVITVDLNKRNFWCGENLYIRPVVINNSGQKIAGEVLWYLDGTALSERTPLIVPPHAVTAGKEVVLPLPKVDFASAHTLSYELRTGAKVICRNKEELTLTPPVARAVNGLAVYPVGLAPAFLTQLVKNGFRITEDWSPVSLCLTTALTPEVQVGLKDGRQVLCFAESGVAPEGIALRPLVLGENWDRASSVNFIDTSFFPGVPLQKVSGWELADLYPNALITNLEKLPEARLIGGSFQGWLGNIGGFLVESKVGAGRLLLSTLRLTTEYNQQPIGTLMVNELITRLGLAERGRR